jgi:hypothetical protein
MGQCIAAHYGIVTAGGNHLAPARGLEIAVRAGSGHWKFSPFLLDAMLFASMDVFNCAMDCT